MDEPTTEPNDLAIPNIGAHPQPVAPAPTTAPDVTQPAKTDAPADGSKKKILLVEDDEALASVYTTRLTAEGFEIKNVLNGEEALSGAINFKPDLILLDVMMPRVSGFDVLDIIRNTPETANMKVLMLTALSQDADKQRAESLGVNDYIVKSQVVIADVVERIKKQLGM
ncbi:MAG TPA: response regulator [Candidatus Saccharimonadales bacterium]|nr:response regulator [Candidatus Saccharimonadales bacterium]